VDRMDPAERATLHIRDISLLWANPERAKTIAGMHAALFSPPWDVDAIKTLLEHPYAAALLAIAGHTREPAGFVIAHIAGDEAEILSVGVVEKWQRHGLGRHLVEGLMRACQNTEARRLFLEVAVDNAPALRLYQALDFKPVGKRPRYYKRAQGDAVDALILSREF